MGSGLWIHDVSRRNGSCSTTWHEGRALVPADEPDQTFHAWRQDNYYAQIVCGGQGAGLSSLGRQKEIGAGRCATRQAKQVAKRRLPSERRAGSGVETRRLCGHYVCRMMLRARRPKEGSFLPIAREERSGAFYEAPSERRESSLVHRGAGLVAVNHSVDVIFASCQRGVIL